MTYLLIAIVGIFIAAFLAVALSGKKKGATRKPLSAGPARVEKPAADEPTPGRSVGATARQIQTASRKVPPA